MRNGAIPVIGQEIRISATDGKEYYGTYSAVLTFNGTGFIQLVTDGFPILIAIEQIVSIC